MFCQSRHYILFGLLAFGLAFSAQGKTPSGDFSIEEKVGQLFLLGVPQKSMDDNLRALVRKTKPGGFIFFRKNLGTLDEIRDFTGELKSAVQKETGIFPFLAVDQEGGPVVRIPVFPPQPSAYSVGAAASPDLSQALGEETGKVLRWCGFNMNLAPVLDLSDPQKPSFIGARSYGGNPDLAGPIGVSFASGLQAAGMLPTAKHFPGLGAVTADPHKSVSERKMSAKLMNARDMKPFAAYAALGPNSALMISQLSYPALDPAGLPAPFSKKIVTDILRKQIGYQGLIVTDDLQMKGIALLFTPQEAALKSLQAGVDVVMISWSADQQRKAIQRVVQAVKSGEFPLASLNERFERVRAIKSFLAEERAPLKSQIAKGPQGEPGTRRLEEVDLKILDLNLGHSSVRAPAAIADGAGQTCVISAHSQFLRSYAQGSHQNNLAILLEHETKPAELDGTLAKCGRIIFAVNGSKTARILKEFKTGLLEKTVLVNLGLPSLVDASTPLQERFELGSAHVNAGFRVAQKLEHLQSNDKK